jgi:hypothetical protein
VEVYRAALECAQNDNLKEEWQKYLEQTTRHEEIMRDVCEKLGVDVDETSPGRQVVHHIGQSLVRAIEMARSKAEPKAAELVACECVVLAETKDHANWELLAQCAETAKGEAAKVLQAAVEQVEDEEDEHVYHSKGYCRELWIESLGMDAVLPPPEEQKDVKTAIGAARAQQQREDMM